MELLATIDSQRAGNRKHPFLASLQDSLQDSRKGKIVAARQEPGAERKRRRKAESDSDDDFYDRTAPKKKAGDNAAAMAHTVESLCTRRDEHAAEADALELRITQVRYYKDAG